MVIELSKIEQGGASLATMRLSGSRVVIALTGEWDLYNRPELSDAIHAAVDGGCRSLVMDLTDATFIDSSVLGALGEAWKLLDRGASGEIVVVTGDRRIRRVLEITGLDAVFSLHESLVDIQGS